MPRHGSGLGAGGFPVANKLLMRYEHDKAYKLHMQKLATVKHKLDVSEPKKHNHLVLRLKQIQKEEERQAEIDHENKLLLSKMTHIIKYHGSIDNWNSYESRSLNFPYRERHNDELAQENINIAHRLETVKPKLQINKWEQDYEKHQYLKKLWNESVKDFTEFRPRRHHSRISQVRSLDNSIDESNDDDNNDDDDIHHLDTSYHQHLPTLGRSTKVIYRKTRSESNDPMSLQQNDSKGRQLTKFPNIVANKALVQHDFRMYRSSKLRRKYQLKLKELKKELEATKNQDKESNEKSESHMKAKNVSSVNSHKSDKEHCNEKNLKLKSGINFHGMDHPQNDLEKVKTLINEGSDSADSASNDESKCDDVNEKKTAIDNETFEKEKVAKAKNGNKSDKQSNDFFDQVQDDANKLNNKQAKGKYKGTKTTSSSDGEKIDLTTKVKGFRTYASVQGNCDSKGCNIDPDSKVSESDKTIKGNNNCKIVDKDHAPNGDIDAESDSSENMTQQRGFKMDNKANADKGDGITGQGKEKQDDNTDVAQLFKIAKMLGKPEDIFIKSLISKTHKQRMVLKDKFRQKYELDLITELKNGLGVPWEHLINALLREPGVSDCYTVFDSLTGKGTKKTAGINNVVEVLCTRDNASIAELKESYKKEFSTNLEEDIADRTKPPIKTILLALQKGQRDESSAVDQQAAKKDAQSLFEAGDGRWNNENGLFMKLLSDKSFGHMQAVFTEFRNVSQGQDILSTMKKDCPKDYCSVLNVIVRCMGSLSVYYVDQLHKHILPTDPILVATLVSRSEVDMPLIRKQYKKVYRVDITEDIKNTPHPTQKCLIELASKVPPGQAKKAKDAKKNNLKDGNKDPVASKKSVAKKAEPMVQSEDRPVDHVTEYANPESASEPKSNEKKLQQSKSKPDSRENVTLKQETQNNISDVKTITDKRGTVKAAGYFRPEDDCEKLHNALSGGEGTEQVVMAIIPKRNNRQRQELKVTYEQKYKKNLMIDLESELQGDHEEIVLALMMPPSEYDAYVLHEAVEGLEFVEAMLIGILCTRSFQELKSIQDHYIKVYKTDMDVDITHDSSGDIQALLLQLLHNERQGGTTVNMDQAEKDAKELHQIGVPSEALVNVITKQNHFQVQVTLEEYKKIAGEDIYASLTKASIGDNTETYINIVKAIEDPVQFYAEKLHACFSATGINDNMLIRIVIPRSEIDLQDIKERYTELYHQNLYDVVNNQCSGDYKTILLAIIDKNDKSDKRITEINDDKCHLEAISTDMNDMEREITIMPYIDNDENKEASNNEKETYPLGDNNVKVHKLTESRPTHEQDTNSREQNVNLDVADDCVRLRKALYSKNPNKDEINKIISSKTANERKQLQNVYQEGYDSNVVTDCERNLKGDYRWLVTSLFKDQATLDAEDMYHSLKGFRNDEDSLMYIITVRSAQDLSAMKQRYFELYNRNVRDDVRNNTNSYFRSWFLARMDRDSNVVPSENYTNMEHDLEDDIHRFLKPSENFSKSHTDVITHKLSSYDQSQYKYMSKIYEKTHGISFVQSIKQSTKGNFQEAIFSLIAHLTFPYDYAAQNIQKSLKGLTRNDRLLMNVILSNLELDMSAVNDAFYKRYKKTVHEGVKSVCGNGDYGKLLLKLIDQHTHAQ